MCDRKPGLNFVIVRNGNSAISGVSPALVLFANFTAIFSKLPLPTLTLVPISISVALLILVSRDRLGVAFVQDVLCRLVVGIGAGGESKLISALPSTDDLISLPAEFSLDPRGEL